MKKILFVNCEIPVGLPIIIKRKGNRYGFEFIMPKEVRGKINKIDKKIKVNLKKMSQPKLNLKLTKGEN